MRKEDLSIDITFTPVKFSLDSPFKLFLFVFDVFLLTEGFKNIRAFIFMLVFCSVYVPLFLWNAAGGTPTTILDLLPLVDWGLLTTDCFSVWQILFLLVSMATSWRGQVLVCAYSKQGGSCFVNILNVAGAALCISWRRDSKLEIHTRPVFKSSIHRGINMQLPHQPLWLESSSRHTLNIQKSRLENAFSIALSAFKIKMRIWMLLELPQQNFKASSKIKGKD